MCWSWISCYIWQKTSLRIQNLVYKRSEWFFFVNSSLNYHISCQILINFIPFHFVTCAKKSLILTCRAKSIKNACVAAGRKRRHIFVDPISGREEPIPISPAKSHRWAHRVFKDLWRNRLSRSRMIWLLPIEEGRAASKSSFYFPASSFCRYH